MKYFVRKLTAGLSLLLSVNVFASTWNATIVGNDTVAYFFDADTVQKTPDGHVLVWEKSVQKKQADSDGAWSTAWRVKLNCKKRTSQVLTSSDYGSDGQFIKSRNMPGVETEVVPDSIAEALLKIACEPNFPNDKSGKNF